MLQKLLIMGNVGREPESRFTPSGAQVTSFSVAANRQYKNSNGEQVKETAWFTVSTWGKLAEICSKYVKKGMKVYVEGRLSPDPSTGGPRIWTGNDGTPHTSFEVTAHEVQFLTRIEESQSEPSEEPYF